MTAKVLITGFNDWKDLDGNVWKCCYNPACILLLGCGCESAPSYGKREGELPKALKSIKDVEFSYTTLPTIWGTGSVAAAANYDIVIHLGLGDYPEDEIVLEDGAFNYQKGTDAIGRTFDQPLSPTSSEILRVQSQSDVVTKLNGTPLPNKYKIKTLAARSGNIYICNETHYRTLTAVSEGLLPAAYFIHIPTKRESDAGFESLAAAISDVISMLISNSKPTPPASDGK